MQDQITSHRSPLTIRPATRRDLAAIARMIAALAAHHGDAAAVDAGLLRRDGLGPGRWIDLLVADTPSGAVGYAMTHRWYRGAAGQRGLELQHLYVEAEHRGAGVGRRLIEAVVARAGAQGCSFVSIGTTPSNTAAQAIYRHLGFDAAPPPGPRFRMTLPARPTSPCPTSP